MLLEFERQDVFRPASELGDAVVGEHIGALLSGREVVEPQRGNLGEAELLRSGETCASGEDNAGFVHQNRRHEAELSDAGDERPHLFFGMGSGGAARDAEIGDGLTHDLKVERRRQAR